MVKELGKLLVYRFDQDGNCFIPNMTTSRCITEMVKIVELLEKYELEFKLLDDYTIQIKS